MLDLAALKTQESRDIITALHQRPPVAGIKVLMAELGCTAYDARMRRHLLALKQLVDAQLVSSDTRDGIARMTLTLRGRQAARAMRKPAPSADTSSTHNRALPLALSAGITGLVAAGCVSVAPPPQPRASLFPYPTTVGMQQVRGPDGEYFVPCNPCAKPSQKTPAAGSLGDQRADAPRSPAAVEPSPRDLAARQATPAAVPQALAAAPRSAAPSAATAAQAAAPEVMRLSVQFAFGEALMSRADRAALQRLAPTAKQAQTVVVKGGADSVGDVKANETLARARTAVVRSELEKLGVPAERIKASHCATCYVAPNDTEEGRRRNRRVDIEVAYAAPAR